MEDILGLLVALFAAFKKRVNGGTPQGRANPRTLADRGRSGTATERGQSRTLAERGQSRTLAQRGQPRTLAQRAPSPTVPQRGRPLGPTLRDALAERVSGLLAVGPAGSANSTAARAASASVGATPGAVAVSRLAVEGGVTPGATGSPLPAPPGSAAVQPVPAAVFPQSGRRDAPKGSPVSALFATPQSLVAAFVVAEVLAKPVALRDG